MLNGNLIINIMLRGLRELVAPKMFFSCTDISDVGDSWLVFFVSDLFA